jgi:hypothetical protein
LFFFAQSVSLVGTSMQTIAQGWLVLQLSGSGAVLGWVVAVQTLPVLLISPYGGVLADRADKRRLLLATQTMMAVLAAVLATLTLTHAVRLWMVFAIAAALGVANSVDSRGVHISTSARARSRERTSRGTTGKVRTCLRVQAVRSDGTGQVRNLPPRSSLLVMTQTGRCRPHSLGQAPPQPGPPTSSRAYMGVRRWSGHRS